MTRADYRAPAEEGWQAFWAEHTGPVEMGDRLHEAWLTMPEVGREQLKQFMRKAFVAGGLHGLAYGLDNPVTIPTDREDSDE